MWFETWYSPIVSVVSICILWMILLYKSSQLQLWYSDGSHKSCECLQSKCCPWPCHAWSVWDHDPFVHDLCCGWWTCSGQLVTLVGSINEGCIIEVVLVFFVCWWSHIHCCLVNLRVRQSLLSSKFCASRGLTFQCIWRERMIDTSVLLRIEIDIVKKS